MISSMNRLMAAYGRPIFLVFTIIIIIAFVGLFTPGFKSMFSGASNTVGTVFKKNISFEDLESCAKLNVINYAINLENKEENDKVNLSSPSLMGYFKKQAFYTISNVRAAEKLGICASAKEIAENIRKKPQFKGKDGEFSMSEFDRFVNKKLLPAGYDKNDLDQAVKQSIILNKLYKEITDTIITTPEEIKQFYNDMYESFGVKEAKFDKKDYLEKVKFTQSDLKNFYEMNKKDYQTQPEYSVEIAKFSYDDFKNDAEKQVTEDAITEYFNTKTDWFIKKEKKEYNNYIKTKLSNFDKYHNKITTVSKAPNKYDDIKDALDQKIPSSETVRKIKEKLHDEKSKELALNKATKFASEIYKHLDRTQKDKVQEFTKAAKTSKATKTYTKTTITPADKSIKSVGYEPEVVKFVQKLSSEMPLSDGIKGNKGAYICYLTGSIPSKQATFKEVKNKVEKNYKAQKALTLSREAAKNAAVKASEAIDKGKKLDDLKSIAKFTDVPSFTGMYPPYTQNGELISKLANSTKVGKISGVENIPNGALFIYLSKRELPKADEFEKQQKWVSMRYENAKKMSAWQTFQGWLNENSTNLIGQ